MNRYQAFILKEMGITVWQLNQGSDAASAKAELSAVDAPLSLHHDTKMLILAEHNVLQSEFVIAVLKSIGLTSAQAQVMDEQSFRQYRGPLPLWVWSTQSTLAPRSSTQVLNSASIDEISQDPLQKRSLWQQIKSYKIQ
ncbi:DNA polymerase III subunit psi [Motilimonas cestriensis]|uniref:DNA polymerase III subunit psi n=1 Tax=Motilimonas cestriensis TaxID=2742685 RepID=A0ABS8W5Q0_9GAMM|nr:DNA polymerase III subunit psi [Motilimonas cestriensis]MCE2593845.1 DNA polymerase III subunit psi [Motilimonas cestriensis]